MQSSTMTLQLNRKCGMKRDKGTMEKFSEGLEGERGFDNLTHASQQHVRDYGIARLPCGKRRKFQVNVLLALLCFHVCIKLI